MLTLTQMKIAMKIQSPRGLMLKQNKTGMMSTIMKATIRIIDKTIN